MVVRLTGLALQRCGCFVQVPTPSEMATDPCHHTPTPSQSQSPTPAATTLAMTETRLCAQQQQRRYSCRTCGDTDMEVAFRQRGKGGREPLCLPSGLPGNLCPPLMGQDLKEGKVTVTRFDKRAHVGVVEVAHSTRK